MRKQTADYFPHYVYKSRTLTFLESKWGCTGYTFWFKLLEFVYGKIEMQKKGSKSA